MEGKVCILVGGISRGLDLLCGAGAGGPHFADTIVPDVKLCPPAGSPM